MARCPHCDFPLPSDRERLGARCANCRDPLYEPPARFSRKAHPDESSCAVHAGMEAVGTCARCGNFMCETCRTPYRNLLVCAACVDRALEAGEGAPEQDRQLFRQALFSLLLGGVAWLLTAAAVLLVQVVAAGGDPQKPPVGLILLLALVLFGDLVPAVFAMGLGAAALRRPGGHMILATFGLILGGLYVGTLLGTLVLAVWEI
jgi:hypothetical protein